MIMMTILIYFQVELTSGSIYLTYVTYSIRVKTAANVKCQAPIFCANARMDIAEPFVKLVSKLLIK